MDHLERLIETYGYLALFIGTFLEGETILVIAGMAAAQGFMDLRWTVVSACCGSVSGDLLHFLIGRYKGDWLLAKFPGKRQRLEKVLRMVERHSLWLVLVFRFMYGIRNITSFAMGMTRMRVWLFMPLNITGAVIWAVVFALGGYLFGAAFLSHLKDFKHYQLTILGLLCVAAMAFWLCRRLWARRASRKNAVASSAEQVR